MRVIQNFLIIFLMFFTIVHTQPLLFKTMHGKTLSGQKVRLPDYFSNRITLVAFGFDRKHQSKIDQVMQPFITRYQNRDSIFYLEIPMIGPAFSWFASFIENGMKKGIPNAFHPHTMSYYQDLKPYLTYYDIKNKDEPFFILVNQQNQIIWQHRGHLTPANQKKLFSLCDQKLEDHYVK